MVDACTMLCPVDLASPRYNCCYDLDFKKCSSCPLFFLPWFTSQSICCASDLLATEAPCIDDVIHLQEYGRVVSAPTTWERSCPLRAGCAQLGSYVGTAAKDSTYLGNANCTVTLHL